MSCLRSANKALGRLHIVTKSAEDVPNFALHPPAGNRERGDWGQVHRNTGLREGRGGWGG